MLDDLTAAATAQEPMEFYDELTPTEQEIFDLIGSRGFRADKNDAGEWVGLSILRDDVLGPFTKLTQLAEAAEKFHASDEVENQEQDDEESSVEVELDEDHKGNTYLPHVKPVVDQQLADVAGDYFARNTEWKDAGKLRTKAKDALDAVVAIKKDLFYQDPDNTRSLIYKAGGLTIRIAKETATKVSVEETKEDGKPAKS